MTDLPHNHESTAGPGRLDEVQRWMQAVVMHPWGAARGIEAAAQRGFPQSSAELEQVLHPSRSQSALQRLEVYSNAYHARLMECLREEFTVMRKAIGDAAFDPLALGYLQANPSRSYTLGKLGANFATFLRESRPPTDPDRWADFLADLAAFERAIGDVFDGPGVEGQSLLTTEELRQISPESWPSSRLIPVPCLRVLASEFPISTYYTAVRRGETPKIPEPCESWVAFTRRDYVVRRLEMSRFQAELLVALLCGKPVGEAIAETGEKAIDEFDAFAAAIPSWFQIWASEGFFLAVESQ